MKQLKTLINKIGRDRLAIILIGGLLILVISIPVHPKNEEGKAASGKKQTKTAVLNTNMSAGYTEGVSGTEYAAYLEKKLQRTLQAIDGAGQVQVMVTLRDVGGSVIEKDIAYERENKSQKAPDGTVETQTKSSDSEKTVFTVDEKGNDIPLVSKQILPAVEGILIVAQGGDNAKVKNEMKRAVLSLFNLDEHKISIVKMKGKNG